MSRLFTILLVLVCLGAKAQDKIFYEGKLYDSMSGSYCIEVGIQLICFDESEYLLRVAPIHLITEAQYDKVVQRMGEFVYASNENELLTAMVTRKDAIIANLNKELSARKEVALKSEEIITNLEKQVGVYKSKERLKKIEDWLERSGSILIIGGALYGGYELGKRF
jgi:hypothetical protein